jgi:hypothetical protein
MHFVPTIYEALGKTAATQNVASVASVASPIPKTTRAARPSRPQAGARFAVTDGRETVG